MASLPPSGNNVLSGRERPRVASLDESDYSIEGMQFFTPLAAKSLSLCGHSLAKYPSASLGLNSTVPQLDLSFEITRFITASDITEGEDGCEWSDCEGPLYLKTDLNHYHSSAQLDFALSTGDFSKVKTLSECNGGKGNVELHHWHSEAAGDKNTVVVKRISLDCLHGNTNSEREDRRVHRHQRKRQFEDTLTEIGVYSFLSEQNATSPFLLKMHTAFHTGDEAWLVLQWAEGGDLFEVVKEGRSSMQTNVRWIWQLLQAVEFLHGLRIGHRDISIENILLHKGDIQLMDFGQAVQTHSVADQPLRYFSPVGKPYYRAPECNVPVDSSIEVVAPIESLPEQIAFVSASTSKGAYLCDVYLPSCAVSGQKCYAEPAGYTIPPADVFACGVCFFIMARGMPPWKEAKPSDQHFAYIQSHGIGKLLRAWGISLESEVQELVAAMIMSDPLQRATLDMCLAHPLFEVYRASKSRRI